MSRFPPPSTSVSSRRQRTITLKRLGVCACVALLLIDLLLLWSMTVPPCEVNYIPTTPNKWIPQAKVMLFGGNMDVVAAPSGGRDSTVMWLDQDAPIAFRWRTDLHMFDRPIFGSIKISRLLPPVFRLDISFESSALMTIVLFVLLIRSRRRERKGFDVMVAGQEAKPDHGQS